MLLANARASTVISQNSLYPLVNVHVKIHVYKKDSPIVAVKNTANELILELSFRKAIIYNICFSMYLNMFLYKS